MRVTNATTYRKFTSSVNDVHVKLNKSMNKITSGVAYETAAENPLAYYTGKKIDQQYLDTKAKNTLITDVKNRLYQQELGARDIQETLSKSKVQVEYAKTATTTGEHDIQTIKEDLMQKVRTIANDLNTQYQDFYVYGGNDVSTIPFDLDISLNPPAPETANVTLTYRHTFPGESGPTEFKLKYASDGKGDFEFELSAVDAKGTTLNPQQTQEKLIKAMSEQGRMDLGYGDIREKNTLLDTYTGGLNVLTGLNSDAVKSFTDQNSGGPDNAYTCDDGIEDALNESPIALISRAILSIDDYQKTSDKDMLDDRLGSTMDRMAVAERKVSTIYSDLGNKYKLLEDTSKRLDSIEDSLTEQYKDALGADPYEAIMEMFNHQYSYNAALQVGSKLMSSSLFDFVR